MNGSSIKKNQIETTNKENTAPVRLHNVDFFISTEGGMTIAVAKKLLLRRDVRSASRSISPNNIDLRVETTLKGGQEVLRLLETIKGMKGVRDVSWNEVVQVIERKKKN